MIFSEQHRQMLAVLAPYLEHEIEVETRAHGRGTLVGLPFCQAPCEKPRAEVRLHSGGCHQVLDLADVKPVLYAFPFPECMSYRLTADAWADLRQSHIAVGLTAHQYIEKPNPTQKELDAA